MLDCAKSGQAADTHVSEDSIEYYLLGRLPLSERIAAARHFMTCAECRRRLISEMDFLTVLWARLTD
jgi:hypothetical protein